MIQAITFDFWDTLAIDDSDEPKRAKLGLPTKEKMRETLISVKIARKYKEISEKRICEAIRESNENFRKLWHEKSTTQTVKERLEHIYRTLAIEPPPGEEKLIAELEGMEVKIPPEPAPAAKEMLAELSKKYSLCIISDAIYTPGKGIHKILESWGMAVFFKGFVFSDEVGASKPSPKVFHAASRKLGNIPLEAIIHVGDRESNDITGPKAVGMKAILYTGVKDRGSDQTHADAICKNHEDLASIVSNLSAKTGSLN